jgi:two-component system NtrC family response regulator
MAAIEGYPWHGNVREMENVIKRAVIMAEGAQITASDLGLAESQQAEAEPINLRQVREDAERKAIIRVMSRVNGNIAQAAEMLGVSRPTLYDLISKYGLKS